jgi:hypothetical protein
VGRIGADGVQLIIEDEEIVWRRVAGTRFRFEHLLARDLEELGAVRLVHRDE